MTPLRRLWTTFVAQPVTGWPRVSWRGGGAPDDADEMLVFALSMYLRAYRARLGVDPPPITRPIVVTFHQGKSVNRRGDKATMVEGRMSLSTSWPQDTIVRLFGHELLHYHRDMLTGDPDRGHNADGFDDVPHMMTDPDHRGWKTPGLRP